MKRTKSTLAMILAIVLCFTAVCPAMGAETAEEGATLKEVAIETEDGATDSEELVEDATVQEEAEDTTAQTEVKEPTETSDQEIPEEQEAAFEGENSEQNSEAVSEDEKTEVVAEEPSSGDEFEEPVEMEKPEQEEEKRESKSDSVDGESVAQAIWTYDNSTMTFYYGPLVSNGDTFNGYDVLSVWSGSDVTDSGVGRPEWAFSGSSYSPRSASKVVFDSSFSVVKPTSTSNWFEMFGQLEEVVDISNLDTSNVSSMQGMFYQCDSLKSLDLSELDTSNVKDMSMMFAYCEELTNLDIKGFDTSNVTDMLQMFIKCYNLEDLDISGFDTSNVTSMSGMFNDCKSLTSLDVSGFDVSNVTSMISMFEGCESLTSLDLSGFDVSSVNDMDYIFRDCNKLCTIYCLNSETDWSEHSGFYMFNNCNALVGKDENVQIVYDSNNVHYPMAKAAGLGGYFTPKNIDIPTFSIDSGFEIFKDNNSFAHSFSNFHGIKEHCYTTTAKFYDYLVNKTNSIITRLAIYGSVTHEDWGGCCTGLQMTMALIDSGYHQHFLSGVGSFWDIDSPLDVLGLRDTIHAYYLLMFYLMEPDKDVNRGDDLTDFLRSLVGQAEYGKPFMLNYSRIDSIALNDKEIGVIRSKEGLNYTDRLKTGHALLVCGYDYVVTASGKKEHRLKIYDCNDQYKYYWMHISDDYSSFSFQDYLMIERSKLLNDESRINLSDTFTNLAYFTYNTITSNAFPEEYTNYYVLNKKPSDNYLLSTERPREVRLTSASNGDASSSILISLDHPFVLTNDAGESLIYDGINTTGSMPVYNYRFSNEENTSMLYFETAKSSSFTVTGCEEGAIIYAEVGGKAYSVDVDTASKIIIDEESGVSISGDAVSFISNSLENGERDDFICVTGETSGECDIVRDGKKVIVTSDEPVKNLGTKLFKNDIFTEYTSDAFENNYLISNEADELAVVTKNDQGIFVPVEIIKISGGDVSNTEISASDVAISGSDFVYTGKEIKPTVTVKVSNNTVLKEGTDFTVSYKNNTNAGTATVSITGKGNYSGTITKTFTINKAAQSITAKTSASTVSVGKVATVSATGAKGAVTYTSSNAAVATVDSKTGKVTAKKVGTVTITAQSAATANYNTASKAVTIKVVPAATASLSAANLSTGIKLKWKKVAGANGYIIYRNGTKIKTITSGSTVTYSDKKANTNGKKYTYKVVAKATTGTSTLSRSRIMYRVARTAVSSLASRSAGKMTLKWKRNSKANGYIVQYSKSKTFSSGNKTATIKKNTLINKTIGSLTKGKKYYVRVRCFKTVSGKKYYSGWSAVKAVTVKK